MKIICPVCGVQKAKRACLLPAHERICPRCCAEIRNAECQGCRHYENAEEYRLSKVKNSGVKHFIAEINEDVEDAVDRALDWVERGQIEKAKTMILELIKEHSGNHTVHFALGVVHAKKKQYDEAIACFDKATEIFPYFAQAYFNKGVAYKEKLEPTNAVRAFQKVTALGDPEQDYVREASRFVTELEKSLRETGGIDLETYLEGERLFNDAFSWMQKKEWGRASAGFKRCLEKNKDHVQSYGNMGICYAHLGRKQEALQALDKALEIDPNYEPALFNRAAIAPMQEGKKKMPDELKMETVEYYKDVVCKRKSYMQQILERFGKK